MTVKQTVVEEGLAETRKSKKRTAKAGTKRVTVNLSDAEYETLSKKANEQMREPNNLLSFLLKDRVSVLVDEVLK